MSLNLNDVPATEKDQEDAFLLSPYVEPYRFENWPPEDLVSFVGGIYAKEAYSK